PQPAARRILAPDLAAEMREMMLETTERGTARRAFQPRGRPLIPGVRIAGKTGTLNGTNPDGRYEWFIGVAPAERPRIAVAVVVVLAQVWHKSSTQVSAQVFYELFCDGRSCSPDAVACWLPQHRDDALPVQAAAVGAAP